MTLTIKKLFFICMALSLTAFSGVMGCSSERTDLLFFPFIVTVDSLNARVFVIDQQNNRINLIDANTNEVFAQGEEGNIPLLDNDDDILIPLFPSNAAVAALEGEVSRLFIIGANATPSQQVIVLDYYSGAESFVVSPISPINVAGAATDVLVGIAVDQTRGLLLVTDTTSGNLHIFDIETGVEEANSPIALGGQPGRLSVDETIGLVAIANGSNNTVSFVDLTDLTAPVATLDVGLLTRDVSLVGNDNGTLLWISASQENTALLYELDLMDLSNADQLLELTAPAANQPPPDPELLTGSLNFVFSGNLTDGQIGGFYTQSTGDLLAIDVTNDFSLVTPNVILIGAISGEGIDGFFNSSGQVTQVYFASPGLGLLTVVDPLTNQFIDQIP